MRRSRFTAGEIIDAYKRTGSVWRAGKELGLSGQQVHARLVALDYPLATRHWDEDEVAELRSLVDHLPIGEIADRLGRPYAGIACKVSELGIGSRVGNRQNRKLPRGGGYDKVSVRRYTKQIDASGVLVTVFARRNGLSVEMLCRALEQHAPEWWQEYRRQHSDLPETECEYCGRTFVPSSGKQRYCSRTCGDTHRRDRSYFGGRRRETIGLAEGVCQLCGRDTPKGLTPHHVLGKENDPDNDALIALCQGCHQIVTILGGRPFVDDPTAWESLISLAFLRKHGGDDEIAGLRVCVEIEPMTPDEWAEEQENDIAAEEAS